jgi:hypothetical protein
MKILETNTKWSKKKLHGILNFDPKSHIHIMIDMCDKLTKRKNIKENTWKVCRQLFLHNIFFVILIRGMIYHCC